MRSLTTRLLGPVVAATLLLYAATFGWILVDSRRRAEQAARVRAEEVGERCAGEVAAYVDRAFQVPRTLAAGFAGLKAAGRMPDRDALNAMLRQTLVAAPELLAVYTLWEPGALDGRDAEFRGKPGHDASGRFIPYWNRGSGAPLLEPLVDYDEEGPGDYFLIPRRTRSDAWIEPYVYPVAGRDVLITSLVSPILVNDSFVGIAGLDFDLATLTELVGRIRPYDTGHAVLLSAGGVVVAHPDRSLLGKKLPPTDPVAAMIGADGSAGRSGSDYLVSVPVTVRGTDRPWRLVVAVPRAAVLRDADASALSIMAAGAGLVAALAAVLWWTARGLARQLREVARSLGASARDTAAAVDQLAAEGHALSTGAQEQAAAVEQTGAALEGLTATTGAGAGHARGAATLAAAARQEAEAGAAEMARMTASLAGSREAADRVARIIKTIDEIAFQTNLLALNAAVEAARAGEHGAGFAVVANEVRDLSRRCAEATEESGRLIEQARAAGREVDDVGGAVAARFERILGQSRDLDGRLHEVRAAAEQQAETVASIAQATRQIGGVTQSNAASAVETAAAATELAAQAKASTALAGRLVELVEGSAGRRAEQAP